MGYSIQHDPTTMQGRCRVRCDHCPGNEYQTLNFTFDSVAPFARMGGGFTTHVERLVVHEGWEWSGRPIRQSTQVVCPACLGTRRLITGDQVRHLHELIIQGRVAAAIAELLLPAQRIAAAIQANRRAPSAGTFWSLAQLLGPTPGTTRFAEHVDIIGRFNRAVEARVLVDGEDTGHRVTLPRRDFVNDGVRPGDMVRVASGEYAGQEFEVTETITTAEQLMLPGVKRLGPLTDNRPIPIPKPKLPKTVWERLLDGDDFDGV